MFGTDLLVDGKKYLAGMVRDAKDPQRMYNYWASAATEAIALAPRAPFIGAKGQFENLEEKWKQANNRNMAYLEYNPISLGGQPIGPPERSTAEPPIQAMVLMLKQADNGSEEFHWHFRCFAWTERPGTIRTRYRATAAARRNIDIQLFG